MSKEDILKAFAELSPEDQEAVRKEIAGGETTEEEEGTSCCPPAFKEHMGQMMEKMKAGGDPMAICKEIMGKAGGKGC